ncbi:lipopolysaccharide heptosyltransferase II [Thiothrix subterranea]|uniref:lipopolysaccharide heptosyltransferase II n=1 Tax=Thiothrix subterranea TaxID=2735563 RepID=A0AA51MNK9_9GAMM|nr:lipopolysaccharide heptosyltransferase II [Thiothrix subterranea]MDQ5768613.1 lipopolysaccharide heptosyltransferase II [Thiothrix subterranea]WML87505.1 lipopolysaccharide heptosyltransferase II [Thiothrix subterranea]
MAFSPQRCLVVGPSWVGDMVMAQSLFMALKHRFPDLQIDVLAPAWSKPILAAMPEVRAAIEMPLQHGELALGKRYQLGKALRANAYDWAIVLPRSLKAALVPFWAKIPVRTGFKGEMRYGLLNDIRPMDKTVLTMTVQRFVALGLPKDAKLPPEIQSPRLSVERNPSPALPLSGKGAKIADASYSSPDKGRLGGVSLLALCPGAEYGAAKRWPAAYYAEVARHYITKGGQVILLGSAKDAPVTAQIAAAVNSPACQDLAGKTSIQDVLGLLVQATQVVSNDSGLMHVAAALGTPVIAVYGSSDPTYTPPLSDNAQILYLGLPCSPCFKRECPLGHLDCLKKITPQQVISLL